MDYQTRETIPAVLRRLSRGQSSARDLADLVRWSRRTAGPRMRALEKLGLVERVVVQKGTLRTDPRHEWRITNKERRLVPPLEGE